MLEGLVRNGDVSCRRGRCWRSGVPVIWSSYRLLGFWGSTAYSLRGSRTAQSGKSFPHDCLFSTAAKTTCTAGAPGPWQVGQKGQFNPAEYAWTAFVVQVVPLGMAHIAFHSEQVPVTLSRSTIPMKVAHGTINSLMGLKSCESFSFGPLDWPWMAGATNTHLPFSITATAMRRIVSVMSPPRCNHPSGIC